MLGKGVFLAPSANPPQPRSCVGVFRDTDDAQGRIASTLIIVENVVVRTIQINIVDHGGGEIDFSFLLVT